MPQTLPGFASTQDCIDRLDVTSDRLTGRGGLALFSRYLTSTGMLSDLERLFGSMRRSAKGLPVSALFKQMFCFLLDGTDRHLTAFDRLKKDAGYLQLQRHRHQDDRLPGLPHPAALPGRSDLS